MKKEEVRKRAKVMFAYADGKEIEFTGLDEEVWADAESPAFNWYNNISRYRIKPEQKYRPFKNSEECWQEMQKHTPFGWIQDKDNSSFKQYILSVDREGVMISDYDDGTVLLKYESLLGFCTFVDGTPFGIKE